MCTPEGPALNIPEALLALGFSQCYEAPFEGVSHRHCVAQNAVGCRRKTSHGGECTARRERWPGGLRGGGLLRRACPEVVVPEAEYQDFAHGVGQVIDGLLQAFEPTGWGELGVDVPSAEHRALEIGRATRPRWYSGVPETVLGLGLSSWTTGWATVKRRGTWSSDRRVLP